MYGGGEREVEVVPSPKSQKFDVVLALRFLKLTITGAQPCLRPLKNLPV